VCKQQETTRTLIWHPKHAATTIMLVASLTTNRRSTVHQGEKAQSKSSQPHLQQAALATQPNLMSLDP
jgi:hypothetical protein